MESGVVPESSTSQGEQWNLTERVSFTAVNGDAREGPGVAAFGNCKPACKPAFLSVGSRVCACILATDSESESPSDSSALCNWMRSCARSSASPPSSEQWGKVLCDGLTGAWEKHASESSCAIPAEPVDLGAGRMPTVIFLLGFFLDVRDFGLRLWELLRGIELLLALLACLPE